MDRRTFLRAAALSGLGLASAGRQEELRLAVIGLNARGGELLRRLLDLPDVRIVALCDVDELVLGRAVRLAREAGARPATYADFRHVLARADVQAVVLATPDHWHALQTVLACRAGKDVFVEAPATHSFLEGERMLAAAREHARLVQVGFQRRADPGVRAALEFLHAGELGAPRAARAICHRARPSIGRAQGNQPIPDTLDYDLWCGPAPLEPLRRLRLHGDWRWNWHTGNGELGAEGAHVLDLARAALATELLPLSVTSVGGRYLLDDDGQTPNTQFVHFEYEAAPILLEVRGLPRDARARAGDWEAGMETIDGLALGVLVECEGGSLKLPLRGPAVASARDGRELRRFEGEGDLLLEWLGALRERRLEALSAELEAALRSSALVHLAVASHGVGSALASEDLQRELAHSSRLTEAFGRMRLHLAGHGLDLASARFTLGPCLVPDRSANCFHDHSAANARLRGTHREPWQLPG